MEKMNVSLLNNFCMQFSLKSREIIPRI